MRTNTEKIAIGLAWLIFLPALLGTITTLVVGDPSFSTKFAHESVVNARRDALAWVTALGAAIYVRHKLKNMWTEEPYIFIFVFAASLSSQGAYQDMVGNHMPANMLYILAIGIFLVVSIILTIRWPALIREEYRACKVRRTIAKRMKDREDHAEQ